MSNGSSFDYSFGSKKNWRRWVWNRISERVPDRRNALCVYLPSSADHDRPIAISKGFRSENLIGVENCTPALRSARRNGALVVHADFFDAVDVMIAKRRVDVVFGDFCCGLNGSIPLRIAEWFHDPNMKDAVFSLNLMRGRDASSRYIREFAAKHIMLDECTKHRGIIAAWEACRIVAINYREESSHFDGERALRLFKFLLNDLDDDWTSYKSTSGQVFDSIVFRNPLRHLCFSKQWQTDAMLCGVSSKRERSLSNNRSVVRNVSAVLAHRTMRHRSRTRQNLH